MRTGSGASRDNPTRANVTVFMVSSNRLDLTPPSSGIQGNVEKYLLAPLCAFDHHMVSPRDERRGAAQPRPWQTVVSRYRSAVNLAHLAFGPLHRVLRGHALDGLGVHVHDDV